MRAWKPAWGVQDELPWTVEVTRLGSWLHAEVDILDDLLREVELFGLWSLGLSVLAVRKVFNLPTGRALALVVGYWVVYLIAVMGFAALSRQVVQGLASL